MPRGFGEWRTSPLIVVPAFINPVFVENGFNAMTVGTKGLEIRGVVVCVIAVYVVHF